MVRQIGEKIWVAEQGISYLGLSVGTRMTVVQLEDDSLAIISPIRIGDRLIEELSELGKVAHIIAPNLYHYLFAADFKQTYPDATFWAMSGLREKKPELNIDQIIEQDEQNIWNGLEHIFFQGFQTLTLSGFSALNECVFYHKASRSLILTDTAFNFDESFPFVTQLATRILGSYKSLRPSILEKIATKDKEKISQAVERVLAWDFERVIMAHGTVVETNAKAKFREGYQWFCA